MCAAGVSGDGVGGSHGDAGATAGDAAEGDPAAFGDAKFADGFDRVVGTGGVVAASDEAAGDGMDIAVIAIDYGGEDTDAYLLLG